MDWHDISVEPPETDGEYIVTLETGRVTSMRLYKGKWSTYIPVIGWMPMPHAMKRKKDTPSVPDKQPDKPAKRKRRVVK